MRDILTGFKAIMTYYFELFASVSISKMTTNSFLPNPQVLVIHDNFSILCNLSSCISIIKPLVT